MRSWSPLVDFSEKLFTRYSEAGDGDIPEELTDWLARLRLFYGVPFDYLVPDERLLPTESIRFFYVDRNWSDRLVDGALSLGKSSTQEYRHHQSKNSLLRTKLDAEEVKIRTRLRNQNQKIASLHVTEPVAKQSSAPDMSGFLLRSRAVANYPGLEVRALKGSGNNLKKMRLLRIERLAPDVLLCLVDGVPDSVEIEEPREGIQFGVEVMLTSSGHIVGSDECPSGFWLKLRHISGNGTGTEIAPDRPNGGGLHTADLAIPVRKSNPQVLHIKALRDAMNTKLQSLESDGLVEFDGHVSAAEMAIQMLQFPFVQKFTGAGEQVVFDEQTPFEAQSAYRSASIGAHRDAQILDHELEQHLHNSGVITAGDF